MSHVTTIGFFAQFVKTPRPSARSYGAMFHSTGKSVWVCPVGVGVGSMLKVRVSLSLLPFGQVTHTFQYQGPCGRGEAVV